VRKRRGDKREEIKEMICRGTGRMLRRSNIPNGLNRGYLLWKENYMEYLSEDHSCLLSGGHAEGGENVACLTCHGQVYPSKIDPRVNAPAYTFQAPITWILLILLMSSLSKV
jgi:hypothetical protein